MRNVIMKQSELINSFIGDMEGDLEMGRERVKVLEDYSQNEENNVNQKVALANQKQQSPINVIQNPQTRMAEQDSAENHRKSI
jgi:hypothetical protein